MPSSLSHATTVARYLMAALLCATFLAGCPRVISMNQNPSEPSGTGLASDAWPYRFKRHNFGAFSYSTYGCKVVYDHFLHLDEPEDELQPSSESIGSNYRDYIDGTYLGIQNFPPPAKVTWRSKDGTPHSAEVDMAAIFKDELVLHRVAKEDVEENALLGIGDPEIILEVNDRTLNVYMKAFIPTKSLRTPGNPHSNFRNDLILAYTRTY